VTGLKKLPETKEKIYITSSLISSFSWTSGFGSGLTGSKGGR
jgi:hypothetical protein